MSHSPPPPPPPPPSLTVNPKKNTQPFSNVFPTDTEHKESKIKIHRRLFTLLPLNPSPLLGASQCYSYHLFPALSASPQMRDDVLFSTNRATVLITTTNIGHQRVSSFALIPTHILPSMLVCLSSSFFCTLCSVSPLHSLFSPLCCLAPKFRLVCNMHLREMRTI
ncbi:hypothetical protein K457DRAFT_377751 [Linnemannia elongata AG-77]|uniref:Uncharacterized protein n=1 Tax=Linnemannia elongata AG-77 TaxID=1314771 RepID=A0A197KEQ5_9FUNG|nr:hypothetical protein K457DRAFT_377751 [Linnemannia elongata AG-77]